MQFIKTLFVALIPLFISIYLNRKYQLADKDRTIVEYRFYRNMQVKDIAKQVGLSSSRVTRIVQASLNSVKEYLNAHEQFGY